MQTQFYTDRKWLQIQFNNNTFLHSASSKELLFGCGVWTRGNALQFLKHLVINLVVNVVHCIVLDNTVDWKIHILDIFLKLQQNQKDESGKKTE